MYFEGDLLSCEYPVCMYLVLTSIVKCAVMLWVLGIYMVSTRYALEVQGNMHLIPLVPRVNRYLVLCKYPVVLVI